MANLNKALCAMATLLVVSQAASLGGWRERAELIQSNFRVWMRNETGSNNGNENGPGT